MIEDLQEMSKVRVIPVVHSVFTEKECEACSLQLYELSIPCREEGPKNGGA